MGHDLINVISQSLGLILQVCTLVTVLYAFIRFTQKPTETLETRVATLEDWQAKTEIRLKQGSEHFSEGDESNRVTQSALLTILDALGELEGIPDSTRVEIKKRRADLWEYLRNK